MIQSILKILLLDVKGTNSVLMNNDDFFIVAYSFVIISYIKMRLLSVLKQ